MFGVEASPSRPDIYAQFHGEDAFSRIESDQWRSAGIQHLVFRVFRNQSRTGGLLFTNSEFRVVKPLLETFLSREKGNNPDVWAWMIARRFDWISDKELLDRRNTSAGLEVYPRLDIFNPHAVRKLLAVYRKLAVSGVKGIMIQDDLILRSAEGLSSWGRAVFSLETGISAHIPSMLDPRYRAHNRWVDVKNRQVAEVVKRIVETCKAVNPDILVGMNLYYETPLKPEESRSWYSHDLDLLLHTGIDRVFLMAYHRQMAVELKLSSAAVLEMFACMVHRAAAQCGRKLVVKIQWRDWRNGMLIPETELDKVLDLIPGGIGGVCFTPLKNRDLDRLRGLLARRGWTAKASEGKS